MIGTWARSNNCERWLLLDCILNVKVTLQAQPSSEESQQKQLQALPTAETLIIEDYTCKVNYNVLRVRL